MTRLELAILPDGRILLAGYYYHRSQLFLRYLPDGTPDESFGKRGRTQHDFAEADKRQLDLILLEDGGFLSLTPQAVYAFQEDGTEDDSFGGGDGRVTTNQPGMRNVAAAFVVDASGESSLREPPTPGTTTLL